MPRWFLSYNSLDLPLVEALEARLRAELPHADIFFAPKTLRAGGYWLPKLAQAIDEAGAFVIIVGANGLGAWQVIEYYEALDKRVKTPDFPVVLILLEGHPAPGLPFLRQVHWIVTADPTSGETLAKLKDAVAGDGARPGELWRHTAPYRGLAAMTEADTDFFFGRDRETVNALTAIAAAPDTLAVLIGNSGVGKSSLAQAGVLGALKRQAWPEDAGTTETWPHLFAESRRWCFLKLTPGTDPVNALIEPFLRTWQFDATDPQWEVRRKGWIDALSSGAATLSGLLDATERRYEELGQPKPAAFFLYIDQGEELYTRSEEGQRHRFSQLIAEAAGDKRLFAMMSLRADFFGALQNDAALFAVHRQINVPPLREKELLEVVSRPAQMLSARFERDQLAVDLARRAAEESAKDAGALPLLSYLLDDMWTEMVARGDGVLRLPPQAMELGGILADRADAFLARHPDARDRLRRLLTLKLATVREDGEPTRRRALRSEFSAEEWRLVTELADHPHRLLVTATPEGGETYVEVAHEAIFRRWAQLREWIAAEREFLVWRSGLEADRRRWEAAPESGHDDALLMGLALTEAQSWLARRAEDLPDTDRQFIEQSMQREAREREDRERERAQRERLRRRMLQVAVVALILVTGLAGVAVFQWIEAGRQATAAVTAKAQAEEEKQRAERNFAAAKQAVDTLVFDAVQRLSRVADIHIETMAKILDTVRQTVDQLAKAAPDDPSLQRTRYAMFASFVDTYVSANAMDAALDAANRGLAIARELAARDPGSAEARRDLSESLARLGDVKLRVDDRQGALAAYEENVPLARDLAALDPSDAAAQSFLASNLIKLADLKLEAGDREAALGAYAEVLPITRKLAAQDPGNLAFQRDAWASLGKLGDLKLEAGDRASAHAAYEESVVFARNLAAQSPANGAFRGDLSASLNKLGDVRLDVGDRDGALAAYKESLASLVELIDADRKLKAGYPQAALAAYEKAAAIRRKIANADAANPEARRDLTASLDKLATAEFRAGDPVSALGSCQEILAIARRQAAQEPGNVEVGHELAADMIRTRRHEARCRRRLGSARRLSGKPRRRPQAGPARRRRRDANRHRRRAGQSRQRLGRPGASLSRGAGHPGRARRRPRPPGGAARLDRLAEPQARRTAPGRRRAAGGAVSGWMTGGPCRPGVID